MPDREHRRAAEFRRRAEQCMELAKQVSLRAHRERLIKMATELLALAEEEQGKPRGRAN